MGGGRGGRGGRGGYVPRGGYQQGGYQQQNFGGRRGGFNSTRAAVIAAIHSSQQNIPAFRVNNRGNNRGYGNNRFNNFRPQQQVRVQQQPIRIQQQPVRIQRAPVQRVNVRGAIQRVGRVQGGIRGRGRIANRVGVRKLPVQQRLGVRSQTFTRGVGRGQRGRVQQQRGQVQRRGRVQVQRGGQQNQGVKRVQQNVAKKVQQKTVKQGAGKVVKKVGAKKTVAVKRGMIKRGAATVRRGSKVLSRGGAARAGSRVIQRGRPALRGRAGARGRGAARGRVVGKVARVKAQAPPTKESLDLDLEKYMANTKTFLDKDIDSYMMSQPQGTVSAINPITAP